MKQASAIAGGSRAPALQISAVSIKALRGRMKLSQPAFAALLGVELSTLRNWEQTRREPTGPARALLRAIRNDPRNVIRALARAAQAVMEDILHAAGADEVITIQRYAHLVGGARMAEQEEPGVVYANTSGSYGTNSYAPSYSAGSYGATSVGYAVPRSYAVSGQYCTDKSGGQVWVPAGSPTDNLNCSGASYTSGSGASAPSTTPGYAYP